MSMPAQRWERINEIFDRAAEMTGDRRTAFLDRECEGDAELRQEVESLLAFARAESPFQQAMDKMAGTILNAPVGLEGKHIGHYRVVEEIGQGGTGQVFLAVRDDDQSSATVAIKLIRPGMGNAMVLDRFRRERQILASLHHDNIARLLDGGADQNGQPYLVMEWVPGKPIDEYCAERNLDSRQRIELMRKVCEAVQHAHQMLVVHRDIKPGNILVTDAGVPKLLDFGIAKLLDPDVTATHTATIARAFTPGYASPEQATGGAVTTLTDIYSLGVVLYELLSGQRPYTFSNLSHAEIIEVICRREPERPDLEPDLTNIVLKAMHKDPGQRYRSAEQLSEDLKRFLEGRPVLAQPDSVGYRIARFIRRNRGGVAATALVATSLIGGIAATS